MRATQRKLKSVDRPHQALLGNPDGVERCEATRTGRREAREGVRTLPAGVPDNSEMDLLGQSQTQLPGRRESRARSARRRGAPSGVSAQPLTSTKHIRPPPSVPASTLAKRAARTPTPFLQTERAQRGALIAHSVQATCSESKPRLPPQRATRRPPTLGWPLRPLRPRLRRLAALRRRSAHRRRGRRGTRGPRRPRGWRPSPVGRWRALLRRR